MTENKRFELKVNQYNQCDIVDWVESKEKNAICIYNDLGQTGFSSAPQVCELLNELTEENEQLKNKIDALEDDNETYHKSLEKLNLYTKKIHSDKLS